jgi:hypothetical protein
MRALLVRDRQVVVSYLLDQTELVFLAHKVLHIYNSNELLCLHR